MTMPALRFTTSWDDGHPLDLRLAELLANHGFSGTFYVPRGNREGHPVMTASELRTIGGAGFEIGGHTLDHVRLTGLPAGECDRQLRDGKHRIEDELGRAITGFCYPFGAHDRRVRRAVQTAGFGYARTVTNLSLDPPGDPFQVGTTLQLYPHSWLTYVKNFVRRGAWRARSQPLVACLGGELVTGLGTVLDHCLEAVLRLAAQRGGVFHLWGHSWEIEARGLWGVLDRFLRIADGLIAREHRLTNAGVIVAAVRGNAAT